MVPGLFQGRPSPQALPKSSLGGIESRDSLAFGQFMLVISSCLPKTFTTWEENCTADLGLSFF